LKILGFFAFIYGWFTLYTFGFDIEGIVCLVVGAIMLGGLEVLSHFEWRRYHNDK